MNFEPEGESPCDEPPLILNHLEKYPLTVYSPIFHIEEKKDKMTLNTSSKTMSKALEKSNDIIWQLDWAFSM